MMPAVSRSEANLLTLARVAVGAYPAQDALKLLLFAVEAPPKLGPTARGLLSDTLARGVVMGLVRGGGWESRGGGRLWERYPPPPLRFTANLVRLFRWMLANPMAGAEVPQLALDAELTLAEQVVVTLLLEQLRGTGCEAALAAQPAVRQAPLVVLAHAAVLARVAPLARVPALDVAASAVVLEGLRGVLARSWVHAERLKGEENRPQVLSRIGQAQRSVLDEFFSAIDRVGQRRLATFLVDAAVAWLATPRAPETYLAALDATAPLRERAEARREAGAFLRAVARLRAWDREHRAVRFIDDGYDEAQRLVKDWERLTEQHASAAAALVTELEALPS